MMDDLRFYILFNSSSFISGRWADDNERLCAMERRLLASREVEPRTARSVSGPGSILARSFEIRTAF